jgi:HlyD family secretion protein
MTPPRRRFVLVLVLLLGAAALALLLRRPAVVVEVAAVERGPLQVSLEEEGETRVEPRYAIAAPVAGRLLRPTLREGDAVERGQTVAMLAPAPLDVRGREQAEAALQAARAAAEEARARADEASAALALARRSRERHERLAAGGHLAVDTLDQARTAERTAAEALDAARHRVEANECQVESARAALLAAAGDEPGNEIALCSPVTARVLRIFERSERVLLSGTPILELGDPAALEVVVDVLSTDAVALPPHAPMVLDVGGGRQLAGRLRSIEPAAFTKVSPLGVEEQRVRVIGELNGRAEGVGDRYRVTARIVVWEASDVLQAPAGALFRDGEGWAAFVVDAGRARRRAVRVGHRNPDRVEVLAGLRPGERVVVYPPERIRDGARVEVR